MSARLLRLALLLPLLAGCGFAPDTFEAFYCASNDECADGQVCFPDGCGDPGTNIAVEVLPSAATGQLAQDFIVEKLQPVQNFKALKPAVLQGEVVQLSPASGELVPFAGQVTITASGESLYIPGRMRSAQYTVDLEQGAFSVPIASGRYSVGVSPNEGVGVPQLAGEVEINSGDDAQVFATIPGLETLTRVDGRLLHYAEDNIPVQSTVVDVQAFDPVTQRPLSQKAKVSSGQVGSTGDFILYLQKPEVGDRVILRATPRDPAAFVPSKSFEYSLVERSQPPLELGDFGVPVLVTGKVVGSDGAPLAEATVYVKGKVGGGGEFQSPVARTDSTGRFSLNTLPSGKDGSLELWVLPAASSSSGLLVLPKSIPATGGDLGQLEAPDKLVVRGMLLRPDGMPAVGVQIEARPVQKLDAFPLPDGTTRGATDADGAFLLHLDPAVYRVDFLPVESLPRASRFITVHPPTGPGDEQEISLPVFSLSNGRRVTGTISSIPLRLGDPTFVAAPYASVKFFRVATLEGRPTSFLLAEGIADANGTYSVLLPTRDASEARPE